MIPSFKTLLTTLCFFCLVPATIFFCDLHTKTRWIPAEHDGSPTLSYGVFNDARKHSFNPEAAGGTLAGSGRSPANTDEVSSCFPEGSARGLKNSACVCKKGWHGRDCSIPDAVWFTDEFRAWYAKGLIRRRSRPRRIINGLVFNHELDLLEIRIKELGDAVDHYLVVESPYTYFGTEKPLHLRNNLSAGFLPEHKHKIVPISVDFFNYNGGDPWGPENYFRTSVWWEGHRRLQDIRDDDIFIMSDADEIPSREVVLFLRHHDGFGEPMMLRLRWFAYGFFWENNAPVDVSGACTVAYIRDVYGNDSLRLRAMRTFAANNMPNAGTFSETWTITGTSPRYAGWHCSWCFDVRGIQVKLAAAQRDDGVRWGDIAEKSDSGYINSLRKKGMYFDGSAGLIRRDPNETAPTFACTVVLGEQDYSSEYVNEISNAKVAVLQLVINDKSSKKMAFIPRMKMSTKGELMVCVSCAVYVIYYILVVVRKPRLVCRGGRLRRLLSTNMDEFTHRYFWAPIWCFGGNLQFFVGCLYNWWLPRLSYRRELFVLSDRGLVALDWVNEDQPGPVVLLAGGGFMDSQSRPWRALVPALTALGYPCVVVNGRGCGGLPLTTHRVTYAASVSDFAEIVAEVRKRYPTECLIGVGVSLGGLQLALYLCQWGPRAQLDAAVAVSPPFQLGLASRSLSRWGTNMLLNIWMTRRFVSCLRDNQEVVRADKVVEADNVFRCWTLGSFNKHYAAPVYGFSSLEDFYSNCSLKGRLGMVQRPLVFLLSSDDALNPPSASLEDEIMNSPWLAAVVTPRGGHMGFVDGCLWPRQPFYLERFVTSFVQGVHRACKSRGVDVLHSLGD